MRRNLVPTRTRKGDDQKQLCITSFTNLIFYQKKICNLNFLPISYHSLFYLGNILSIFKIAELLLNYFNNVIMNWKDISVSYKHPWHIANISFLFNAWTHIACNMLPILVHFRLIVNEFLLCSLTFYYSILIVNHSKQSPFKNQSILYFLYYKLSKLLWLRSSIYL